MYLWQIVLFELNCLRTLLLIYTHDIAEQVCNIILREIIGMRRACLAFDNNPMLRNLLGQLIDPLLCFGLSQIYKIWQEVSEETSDQGKPAQIKYSGPIQETWNKACHWDGREWDD